MPIADLKIDNFKAKLTGGGARSNLFRVIMNFPSYAQGDIELASYMAKAASFPPSTTEAIDVPFRGRQIPLEGDRTFPPITITFINDVTHPVRDAFVRWKNQMSNHSGNIGLSNPADYMVDFKVEQLSKDGTVTATYDIRSGWPLSVGEIEVSFENNNTVEEFPVEFRYLYWTKNGVAG